MEEPFYLNPMLWVTAAFVGFLALAGKRLLRLITASLDARGARIREELDEALRLKEEALALLTTYKAKQQQALAEAEAIVRQAQAEAARVGEQAQRDLESLVAKRTELVMQRLAQLEAQALKDLQANTVDIAVAAARAIVKEQLAQNTGSTLLTAALADAERKLH